MRVLNCPESPVFSKFALASPARVKLPKTPIYGRLVLHFAPRLHIANGIRFSR
jgi:hypothetical protein